MSFEVINVIELLDLVGEDMAQTILSDFSCEKNPAIEHFLKHNAINFAKQKLSITHLVFTEDALIAGYFTLTHKPLVVDAADITSFSNSDKRRLKKHARFDDASQTYALSAFLLAQFGKNDHAIGEAAISGNDLMALAIDTLRIAQHVIGGGVIFLECEEQEKLLNFYQKPENGYKRYGFRHSAAEQMGYVQLLRFF